MNQSTQVIINASAHEIPLPDGMIHTVVTSPPYYSLRRYEGAQEVDWPDVFYAPMPGIMGYEWGRHLGNDEWEYIPIMGEGEKCLRIPPMRCALGLEPTPEAYIGHLVLCFREVMRVLREDGTAWVVMGDSYGAGTSAARQPGDTLLGKPTAAARTMPRNGLDAGQLVLIPARLALALQGDGWLVRNDPPWAKTNPMPESVSGWAWQRCRVKVGADRGAGKQPTNVGSLTAQNGGVDVAHWTPCPGCEKCAEHGGYVLRRGSWRHTRAHETVLMLAKGMGYYADQERGREEAQPREYLNWEQRKALGKFDDGDKRQAETMDGGQYHYKHGQGFAPSGSGRNPRSVLTPRPESYSGNHYAVFPRTLISPLLRATAPTRVCPVCAAPWCPVVEREGPTTTDKRKELGFSVGSIDAYDPQHKQTQDINYAGAHGDNARQTIVWGYRPTCDCGREDWQPGWCLDPFVGSGTSLEVCRELGVNGIGLDISPQYLDEHAKPRIGQTPARALETLPLFAMDPDQVD